MNHETLMHVLSKMLGTSIARADAQEEQLHGGTLGDVRLISGAAQGVDGEEKPYKVVWKRQKKWERPGDPASWRREYDLYRSDLKSAFTDSLRPPVCYHAEMNEDENEIQLWMEYIDGISGRALTVEMLEQASLELGRFQGRLHKSPLKVNCLNDTDFMEREFNRWHAQAYTYDFLVSERCRLPEFIKRMLKEGDIRLVEGKSFEYGYLRSSGCDAPVHLKQMLMDIDERKDEIFHALKKLPIVLCHRDFWIENIVSQDGKIRLIDWDTSGWGYAGEDIASLIVDETDASSIAEYCRRLIPAYYEGLSEHMDISRIAKLYIREMILIKFGYRILQAYMLTEARSVKEEQIAMLQSVYAMEEGKP